MKFKIFSYRPHCAVCRLYLVDTDCTPSMLTVSQCNCVDLIMATNIYVQTIFFILAVIFTLSQIKQRFFTNRVSLVFHYLSMSLNICQYLSISLNICQYLSISPNISPYLQTSVTYLTRKLWEMEEFPVFLTFSSTPGYDRRQFKS